MEKEILKAAEIWADYISKPFKNDAGDSKINFLTDQLMLTKPLPNEYQVELFKDRLNLALLSKHEMWPNAQITFGTDYGPDTVLIVACHSGNLYFQRLPIKSHTIIDKGEVRYKFGYSAQYITVKV